MSEYSDTLLIDCSRLSSEEAKGGDDSQPSLWNNKIGAGVRLNVGDKVSVHSGFASERGCGGNVIEFDGKDLKTEYTLSETYKDKSQPFWNEDRHIRGVFYNPPNYEGVTERVDPYADLVPDNYMQGEWKTREVPKNLKDNEVNIAISYYKTTSGTGYFCLPRRFDCLHPADGGVHIPGPPAGQFGTGELYKMLSPLYQEGAYRDRFDNGRTVYPFMFWKVCRDDYKYYADGFRLPGQNVGAGDPQNWDMINKQKNGCERFTIYKKKKVFYGRNTPDKYMLPDNVIIQNDTSSGSDFCSDGVADLTTLGGTAYIGDGLAASGFSLKGLRDPALSEFVKYQEIKTLSVNKGYQAPENVAQQLTDQLTRAEDPEVIHGQTNYRDAQVNINPPPAAPTPQVASGSGGVHSNEGRPVTSNMEGECFKAMECATCLSFTELNYHQYIQPLDTATGPQKGTRQAGYFNIDPFTSPMADNDHYGINFNNAWRMLEYVNSYETIAIKRPELWEAGRDLTKNTLFGPQTTSTLEVPMVGLLGVAAKKIGDGVGVGVDDTALPFRGGSNAEFCMWREAEYNFLTSPVRFDERQTGHIQTSWEWTDYNLGKLQALFDAQGKYPELFKGYAWAETGNLAADNPIRTTGLTVNNARFLHMNTLDTPAGQTFTTASPAGRENGVLGDDGYNNFEADVGGVPLTASLPHLAVTPSLFAPDYNKASAPIFIYYDESRKDMTNTWTEDQLYKGLFFKKSWTDPPNLVTRDVICFNTKDIGGIPEFFWKKGDPSAAAPAADTLLGNSPTTVGGAVYDPTNQLTMWSRLIGWDCHFSAYGTAAICLFSGYMGGAPYRGQWQMNDNVRSEGVDKYNELEPAWNQIRKRYIGANSPLIAFDEKASRFNFAQLHTPLYKGNNWESGGGSNNLIDSAAGNPVYFLNRRLHGVEYCPDMLPYEQQFQVEAIPANPPRPASGDVIVSNFNWNLEAYKIYDSDCGIFIEDLGVPEAVFDKSLWGILGFTFNQFNTATNLTRQTRINDSVTLDDMKVATTNANVDSKDLVKYVTNQFGAPLFTNQLPVSFIPWEFSYARTAGSGGGASPFDWTRDQSAEDVQTAPPEVVIDQTSAQINAEKLPRKMIRPYFLIKSNIVGDANFLGGEDSGQVLPVVYVLNKENAFGDFFFGGESQTEFTITKAQTLSSVTTSIHDPDGSLANVSLGSSIIYKVVKPNTAQLGVAQEILKTIGKKQKSKM